jgi:hypothetical protein
VGTEFWDIMPHSLVKTSVSEEHDILTVEEEVRLETSKKLAAGFLLGLHIDSKNGGNVFL